VRLVVGDDDDACDDCTGLVRIDGDVADAFLRIVRGEPNIFCWVDHASTTAVDAIKTSTSIVLINIALDIMMKCMLKM
jgi:hypothetical protein